jgi:hypothetical protein
MNLPKRCAPSTRRSRSDCLGVDAAKRQRAARSARQVCRQSPASLRVGFRLDGRLSEGLLGQLRHYRRALVRAAEATTGISRRQRLLADKPNDDAYVKSTSRCSSRSLSSRYRAPEGRRMAGIPAALPADGREEDPSLHRRVRLLQLQPPAARLEVRISNRLSPMR